MHALYGKQNDVERERGENGTYGVETLSRFAF